ncbi:hypothetical protein RHGRI_024523 [Rhododendron griersonianum]|uniref:Reverse transcriptase domain-containing protein n=1 Tax=Rhododendron griersonianum TaxID=479676 RepID=A0AAV6JEY2_9ERIC|nr:hypothetical protein RHGRI_024523 [Rhododendron griersonianum]
MFTLYQLVGIQKQLEQGFNPECIEVEKELTRRLEDLWQKDSMFWHQRSRIKWLQMGDRNSRFFHLSTIQRRQRNQIVRLRDGSGTWRSEAKEVAGVIKAHFQVLYDAPPNRDFEEILSLIDPVVTAEMNAKLVKAPNCEEIRLATFQLGPLKAPGSDGFPGLFFQSYWEIVGNDVTEAVKSFFQNGVLLREWNQTNVTLIPKVKNPESMSHFRPISLCRFIYKVISKVLANRLQPFMHGLISEQQSAFIPGRQIQDNIIIAHEVFHFLKHKKSGRKASVAVKLDLNKAYDRVCWDFLLKVLEKLGFEEKWIDWISQCVCTVKYSIHANGGQVCVVEPKRGLRQGDPISPYLFLMVADVLSTMLQKAVINKSLAGIKMKKQCPVVSHLFFADDSLIFLEANSWYCSNLRQILGCFSEASGLSVNLHKSSVMFSANASHSTRDELKGILEMKDMDKNSKYLGLPTSWGKSKKESMGFIRDNILGKIKGWSNKDLNQAGKEILIKSVIQPIPMYPFMCFKAPNSLCSQLNSVISNFWWENGDNGGKIHWGSWKKLTDQKEMGGMGFKDFASFNIALLAKQYWRLINSPEALWVKVLKGLYFPNCSSLDAKRGPSPSWIWCSLVEGMALLKEGLRWNVGNGDSIDFWRDRWIPNLPGEKVQSIPSHHGQWAKVSEFIDSNTHNWDMDKLLNVISSEEARAISRIPISYSNGVDKIIWVHTSSGNYSVKSGYCQVKTAVSKGICSPPSTSYTPPKSMWTRLWAVPTAPKVRLFMWKVVRNWVACKSNLYRRKCAQVPLCPICETESESIEHILFRCPWTKAVWFGSGKAFWVLENSIISADKWMEDLLCGTLAKEATPEIVGAIFQICWAIWKARNECNFQGKLPNPITTIQKAEMANGDYLQAAYMVGKIVVPIQRDNSSWSPPPPGVLKINVDGAFSSSRGVAAFGVIARDSSGIAQFWRCGKVKVSSACAIEAWALRIACNSVIDADYSQVIFESDSQVVMQSVQGRTNCPWEIYTVVEDIKTWAKGRNWSFIWAGRMKNKAAHWLASYSINSCSSIQLGCIPPEFDSILRKDCNS